MTSLGGSRMSAQTLKDMTAASKHFVDLNALLKAAGAEVARLCKAPAGYDAHITTGSAAALALAVAACITKDDHEVVKRLPRVGKAPHAVLIDGASDTRWNQSMELTGAKLQLVGRAGQPMTEAQLQRRLKQRPSPVAVVVFAGGLDEGSGLEISKVITIAQKYQVPVIVDAAAQLPPKV